MKIDIHPKEYREVVFEDINNGERFITRSTAKAEDTVKIDGKEYPLVKVHISSRSHPFFTGEEKVIDVEGRVDKFKKRAKAAADVKDKRAASAQKEIDKQAKKDADAIAKATEKATVSSN